MLFSELTELSLEGDCEVSFVTPPIVATERRNTATQETMLVATRWQRKETQSQHLHLPVLPGLDLLNEPMTRPISPPLSISS